MYLKPTNQYEVKRSIDILKLHKSEGIDQIPVKIVSCSNIFCPILVELINKSFQKGVFPDCLKIARVTPLFKACDRDQMKNYRPISVSPVLSKVFERIMHNSFYSYLETFGLLSSLLDGFRSKRSTIEIIENIRHSDKIQCCKCVFLDLSKAFDTIIHKILLQKLPYFGISGNDLKWFESDLTKRQQLVKVGESLSQKELFSTG